MKIQLFPRWAVALALGAAISLAGPAVLAAQKKTPTPAADDASKTSKPDKAEKINLNTADEKTIAGAKGVGEKLAKELVKNRPYKTWEEVSAVKGVGSGKKLDSLKKVLKLSEGVAAAADEKTAKDKGSKTAKPSEAPPAARGRRRGGGLHEGEAGDLREVRGAEARPRDEDQHQYGHEGAARRAPGDRTREGPGHRRLPQREREVCLARGHHEGPRHQGRHVREDQRLHRRPVRRA